MLLLISTTHVLFDPTRTTFMYWRHFPLPAIAISKPEFKKITSSFVSIPPSPSSSLHYSHYLKFSSSCSVYRMFLIYLPITIFIYYRRQQKVVTIPYHFLTPSSCINLHFNHPLFSHCPSFSLCLYPIPSSLRTCDININCWKQINLIALLRSWRKPGCWQPITHGKWRTSLSRDMWELASVTYLVRVPIRVISLSHSKHIFHTQLPGFDVVSITQVFKLNPCLRLQHNYINYIIYII